MSERKATEKRRHARSRKRIQVRFGPGDLAHNGYTVDISEGGLHLWSTVTYPPNSVLVLQIAYPEKTETVRGIVRWSKDLPPAFRRGLKGGMGIEFSTAVGKRTTVRAEDASPATPRARIAPVGSPPEATEEELGGGATRRRQVSTRAGNTYEVLQTEFRGAHYVRMFQLPLSEGSAEALLRLAFWTKEEAEAAVKAFLKQH